MSNVFGLASAWTSSFEQHARVIREHVRNFDQNGRPAPELTEALKYFGWKTVEYDPEGDDPLTHLSTEDESHYEIGVVRDLTPNPALHVNDGNKDFFDRLRDLDNSLTALKREIESINDPTVVTRNLNMVRAYIDSLQAFLDIDGQNPPPEIPSELPRGLFDRIREVDWASISARADSIAQHVSNLIKTFFG